MNRQKLIQFLIFAGLIGLTTVSILVVVKLNERLRIVPRAQVEPPVAPQCTYSFTLEEATVTGTITPTVTTTITPTVSVTPTAIPSPTQALTPTPTIQAGRCPAHPDLPDYRQLVTVEAKPVVGFPSDPIKLPLPQTFEFSLTVRNTGITPFSPGYFGGLNKCLPQDLTQTPWKCTGPYVSAAFPRQQTEVLQPGETKMIRFSSSDIVCKERYQYDIYIPGGLAYSTCGPDMAGLVEFTCTTPTLSPTPLPTATPIPTNTPVPTTPPPAGGPPPTTNTPLPTNTPVPTNTPRPTNTPIPTSTPKPQPTVTPLLVQGLSPTRIPVPKTPTAGSSTPTFVFIGAAAVILTIGALVLLL